MKILTIGNTSGLTKNKISSERCIPLSTRGSVRSVYEELKKIDITAWAYILLV